MRRTGRVMHRGRRPAGRFVTAEWSTLRDGQVFDLRLLGFGERQLNNLLSSDARKVEQALARSAA
jgi:hypothetical protein